MRVSRRGTARLSLVALAGGLLMTVPGPAAAAADPPLFDVPPAPPGVPSILDGDPTTTERLLRSESVAAALAASEQRFATATRPGRWATHGRGPQ